MKKICYYNGKYKRRVNGVETEIDTATEAFGRSSRKPSKKPSALRRRLQEAHRYQAAAL
jgi:hypothetical protein